MSIVEHDQVNEVVADERQQARKRVQARRDFGAHLVSYLVVNAFLILVWAVTGAGYFCPIWVIGGRGVGLALHAWDSFLRKPGERLRSSRPQRACWSCP